jgi:hypothetical protein
MAITACLLISMFGYRFTLFKSIDPSISYQTMNPTTFKEFGSFSNAVGIGLYIDDFEQFNIVKNEFLFTGQIWFVLAPGSIALSTLEKFSFARGDILYCSSPFVKVIDNQLFVQYNIRVKMNSPLNLSDFPVDNHTICIQVDHMYMLPNEILFEPMIDNFRIKADLKTFGWRIIDRQVKSGYIQRMLDGQKNEKVHMYPTAIFYFDVIRYGIQHTLTIFLPLLLILFVILFCFSVREIPISFSLAVGGLTTILAYRFVIVNMSPQVGYSMMTDYLFLLILASGVGVFLIHVNDVFYVKKLSITVKKMFLIAIHVVINMACFYLLYW